VNFSEFGRFREFQQITTKMSTILVVFLLLFSPLGGRNSDGRRKHVFCGVYSWIVIVSSQLSRAHVILRNSAGEAPQTERISAAEVPSHGNGGFQAAASDGRPRYFAKSGRSAILLSLNFRGRTGFDLKFEAQAACRGWFVGLVKNRAKKNKRRSPRSRSRGLIDRDVWSWTPATAPNVDSRLIVRRSDRAGR
jgi:hypothetical protein